MAWQVQAPRWWALAGPGARLTQPSRASVPLATSKWRLGQCLRLHDRHAGKCPPPSQRIAAWVASSPRDSSQLTSASELLCRRTEHQQRNVLLTATFLLPLNTKFVIEAGATTPCSPSTKCLQGHLSAIDLQAWQWTAEIGANLRLHAAASTLSAPIADQERVKLSFPRLHLSCPHHTR